MIRYQFFPRSQGITGPIQQVIDCFNAVDDEISSKTKSLSSDKVLAKLRIGLEAIGFRVEAGKTSIQKISVPVLFGLDNKIDKSFNADAVSSDGKIVIEVEAGRAVVNNQFLKDVFQACMMFEVEYLVIAVRNDYRGKDDFKQIHTFLETLYVSNRLQLPLKGILLVGY
ncbi:MAG TPA: hypothetical protein PLK77_02225 [Pyrinomonadaceae bacterium]|nr:hypothetical protein [Pyrinomonadaceae bacterium]